MRAKLDAMLEQSEDPGALVSKMLGLFRGGAASAPAAAATAPLVPVVPVVPVALHGRARFAAAVNAQLMAAATTPAPSSAPASAPSLAIETSKDLGDKAAAGYVHGHAIYSAAPSSLPLRQRPFPGLSGMQQASAIFEEQAKAAMAPKQNPAFAHLHGRERAVAAIDAKFEGAQSRPVYSHLKGSARAIAAFNAQLSSKISPAT
jgi:hypothetical protein